MNLGPTLVTARLVLRAPTQGAWALLGYSMFAVVERETVEWIGRLGPWRARTRVSEGR
jgi:hypothetical protein